VGLSTADFTHGNATLRCLFSLNPMVGIIDGFRFCVFGEAAAIYWPGMWISIAALAAVCWAGVGHFRRTEGDFADVI
jgi:lipopolysaccharide transport system permease protein